MPPYIYVNSYHFTEKIDGRGNARIHDEVDTGMVGERMSTPAPTGQMPHESITAEAKKREKQRGLPATRVIMVVLMVLRSILVHECQNVVVLRTILVRLTFPVPLIPITSNIDANISLC